MLKYLLCLVVFFELLGFTASASTMAHTGGAMELGRIMGRGIELTQ
jgi:hypothetical protein